MTDPLLCVAGTSLGTPRDDAVELQMKATPVILPSSLSVEENTYTVRSVVGSPPIRQLNLLETHMDTLQ